MASDADIEKAGGLICEGKLVAFATETVYGLGADALSAEAVAGIFKAKARPSFDPLIVHVMDADVAWMLVAGVPDIAKRLADAFWPGPMTLVLPRREVVPGIVTAGLNTVGLRVPAHPTAQALLRAACTPIAAPSANLFGGISPTRAEHVTIDCAMVLDGGPCTTGVESTVLRPEADGRVTLLRPGGLAAEEVKRLIGEPLLRPDPAGPLASPGMLERHYAPRTPLILAERDSWKPEDYAGKSCGFIGYESELRSGAAVNRVLSPSGDLTEAAARLFETMHDLDGQGLDCIVAETVPDHGLGVAINDRLRRASVR